jgi:hypothetical protein
VRFFSICAYQHSSAAKGFGFSISAIFGNLGNPGNLVSDPRPSAFIRGKDLLFSCAVRLPGVSITEVTAVLRNKLKIGT